MLAKLASSRLAIIAGAIALVLLFSGVGSTLTLSGSLPVPNEESYRVDKMQGHVQFKSGRGSDDRFVSSWYADGNSEPFTVAGRMQLDAHAGGEISAYQYHLYAKTSTNGEWRLLQKSREYGGTGHHTAPTSTKTLNLEPWAVSVTGPTVGVLRAELHVKALSSCGFAFLRSCESEYTRAAQDGARIVSGVGSINFDRSSNRYEEGETVRLNVRTDQGTWRLTLFDGTGSAVCGPKWQTAAKPLRFFEWGQSTEDGTAGGDQKATLDRPACSLVWTGVRTGTIEYRVPDGAFKPGGKNEWSFALDNEVTNQQALKAFIVDMHEKAPEVPESNTTNAAGHVIEPSSAPVAVGERLTYLFESRANPASGTSVSHFVVYIWHGDSKLMPTSSSADWIANGVQVSAVDAGGGLYKGSYVYSPLRAAHIQAWAVAVDAEARPSGSAITGDQAAQQAQGTAADDEEPNGIPDPNTNSETSIQVEGAAPAGASDEIATPSSPAIALVLLTIVGLVGAYAAFRFLPLPGHARIAIAGVLLAITFVIMWANLGVS